MVKPNGSVPLNIICPYMRNWNSAHSWRSQGCILWQSTCCIEEFPN